VAGITLAPPESNEVELSVFGPGYGESCVVHLGGGKWLVNDSCINRETRRPAALDYLTRIGVNIARDVPIVTASHWHDDHIRGIAEVLTTAESAVFVCSIALKTAEFLQLIEAAETDAPSLSSGLSEFRRIIDIVTARQSRRPSSSCHEWAMADRTIWKDTNTGVSVHSLSPSSSTVTSTLRDIGAALNLVRDRRIRVPSGELNHTCVVMWVDFQHCKILLGGDLERHADATQGWDAIVSSRTRPDGRALAYKVSHHGSVTGFVPGIKDMLAPDNVSVVTPFARGRIRLPTREDVARVSSLSAAAYVTSTEQPRAPRPRQRVVEKTVKEICTYWRAIDASMGQVQLRRLPGEEAWRIGLSSNAGPISAAVAGARSRR
jgi:beta-lactamase superfamily II metal-dependent hydrolase